MCVLTFTVRLVLKVPRTPNRGSFFLIQDGMMKKTKAGKAAGLRQPYYCSGREPPYTIHNTPYTQKICLLSILLKLLLALYLLAITQITQTILDDHLIQQFQTTIQTILDNYLQCDNLQPCKKFLLITCDRINYRGQKICHIFTEPITF